MNTDKKTKRRTGKNIGKEVKIESDEQNQSSTKKKKNKGEKITETNEQKQPSTKNKKKKIIEIDEQKQSSTKKKNKGKKIIETNEQKQSPKKKGLSANVHGYERKLESGYKEKKRNDTFEYCDFNDAMTQIEKIISEFPFDDDEEHENMKRRALKTALLLRKDKEQKRNQDRTNNINIEDVMPRVLEVIKRYDNSGKMTFIEQMADVSKGSCSQGRVVRLVQFYIIS
jgi:hypothetical protein